jgi:hypothetical protein
MACVNSWNRNTCNFRIRRVSAPGYVRPGCDVTDDIGPYSEKCFVRVKWIESTKDGIQWQVFVIMAVKF